MNHNCESCSFRFDSYPKTPCKIGNNRFFRNFPRTMIGPNSNSPGYSNYCNQNSLSIQQEPLIPAGASAFPSAVTKRKASKVTSRKCAPKKLTKKRPSRASARPTVETFCKEPSFECPPPTAEPVEEDSYCKDPSPCVSIQNSECGSTQNRNSSETHPGDCGCDDCYKNEPSVCDVDSFIEGGNNYIGDGHSSCAMSKISEKTMSNYLYDNPELRESSSKKQSACAEILDCLDEDSEVWLLQTPKCFDVNKLLGGDLKKGNGMAIDLNSDRFKTCVNMICITPEKATEYKSVCNEVRLIRPVGKIMVTESQQLEVTPVSESCSDDEQMDDDCSIQAVDSVPLASKKVQKKLNDQRFTIETTVTVENCGNQKKGRKSQIKQESEESCLPMCPPEPQPMKRKKKNC